MPRNLLPTALLAVLMSLLLGCQSAPREEIGAKSAEDRVKLAEINGRLRQKPQGELR